MVTVSDIAAAIADRTNPTETPAWDPVGIQLGDPDSPVASVAVCHEVNEDVVAAIEETPVDLLVTYHPLLFNPTNRILGGRSPGARAYRLIRAGVNLLVTHTDFDAAPGGTADALAGLFDLGGVRVFGADPENGLPAIGRYGTFAGTIGQVDAILSDVFGHAGLRVSGNRDQPAGMVAVVPGSGSALIEEAARVARVLVTGDVSHHRVVAALDLGLAIVDPGHVATERPGMRALVELVAEVSGLAVVDLTALDPQTWE